MSHTDATIKPRSNELGNALPPSFSRRSHGILMHACSDLRYDSIGELREKSNGRILARFPIITFHATDEKGRDRPRKASLSKAESIFPTSYASKSFPSVFVPL